MKRKIATLDVYVSDDKTASGTRQTSPSTFELTMNAGSPCNPTIGRLEFQTIMAHELGHFVALVTHDPTHNVPVVEHLLSRITGDASALVPGEKRAWEIAREILPNLDTAKEKKCLDSYKATTWGSDPEDSAPRWYWVTAFLGLAVLAVVSVLAEIAQGLEVLQ